MGMHDHHASKTTHMCEHEDSLYGVTKANKWHQIILSHYMYYMV